MKIAVAAVHMNQLVKKQTRKLDGRDDFSGFRTETNHVATAAPPISIVCPVFRNEGLIYH